MAPARSLREEGWSRHRRRGERSRQLKRFQGLIQDQAAAAATWMVAEIPTSLKLIEAQLGKTGSGTSFPFLNLSRRAGRAATANLHI